MCDNRVARDVGRITYTQMLNSRGGIECDFTVTRLEEELFQIVTGTAFGNHDLAWMRRNAPEDGYHPTSGESIPFEARIIAVADVYDALTSDRPYRKAMSPFEARDVITNGENTEFDPKVVAAFSSLFRRGELEIWSAPLSAA